MIDTRQAANYGGGGYDWKAASGNLRSARNTPCPDLQEGVGSDYTGMNKCTDIFKMAQWRSSKKHAMVEYKEWTGEL